MKVVLDTNVLVSALIVKLGKPAQIFKQLDKFDFYLSKEIIKEIDKVLHYKRIKKKYNINDYDIKNYLRYLKSIAKMYKTKNKVFIIKDDPDDNKFLVLAEEQKVDYIVSGDPHLTNLKYYKKTLIVTPAKFLKIINKIKK